MIICLCRSISDKEVKKCVFRQKERISQNINATTVCGLLKIGENCGGCKEFAEEFVRKLVLDAETLKMIPE